MLELQLAWRNLLRQKRRSILTGISIAGGYFLITFAVSLIEGSYGNMIEIFTRDRVGHVQLHAPDYRVQPGPSGSFGNRVKWFHPCRVRPILSVSHRESYLPLAYGKKNHRQCKWLALMGN